MAMLIKNSTAEERASIRASAKRQEDQNRKLARLNVLSGAIQYKNQTSEETRLKLERKKQEMLA